MKLIETDKEMSALKPGTKLKLKYRDGRAVKAYTYGGTYNISNDPVRLNTIEIFFGKEHPQYLTSSFASRVESVEVWSDTVPAYTP